VPPLLAARKLGYFINHSSIQEREKTEMDPGTALGAVSLGIEVCKGLLAYYRDWKDHKKDIQETLAEIDVVSTTLSLLGDTLRSDSQTALTAQAQKCLYMCQDGIQQLDKKLKKMHMEAPQGLRQQAQAGSLRLIYPLRKSTLEKLNGIAQRLIQQLKLAIAAIVLDNGLSTQHTVDQIRITLDGNTTLATQIQATTLATQAHLLSAKQAETLAKTLAWLAAPDPSINHAQARAEHEPGTGEWLFNSQEYQDWVSGSNPLFWLHGKAGCCKTIMCSTIVEDVRRRIFGQDGAVFAYFYFSFSDAKKQSYTDCLSSMVTQLSRGHCVHPRLHSAWFETQPGRPSIQLLEDILLALIKEAKITRLVVDALDECSEKEREQIVEGFKRITQDAPKTSFLITSRKEADIEDLMASWCGIQLPIDEAAVNKDIDIFIKNALATDKKLARFTPETKKEIEDMFHEKSDGM
jgi:hypothetical protein